MLETTILPISNAYLPKKRSKGYDEFYLFTRGTVFFKKVEDSCVDHELIIKKLQSLKIINKELDWFKCYLSASSNL